MHTRGSESQQAKGFADSPLSPGEQRDAVTSAALPAVPSWLNWLFSAQLPQMNES